MIYRLYALSLILCRIAKFFALLLRIWKPLPYRFKDYIHAEIQICINHCILRLSVRWDTCEIQIRTWEMHRVSNMVSPFTGVTKER